MVVKGVKRLGSVFTVVLLVATVAGAGLAWADSGPIRVCPITKAWTWGNNTWGELGNGQTSSGEYQPQAVHLPVGSVLALAGGRYYSLALSCDGSVSGFGYDQRGTLGLGVCCGIHPEPERMQLIDSASLIAAGGDMTHVLQETTYGAGGNERGQIGAGFDSQLEATPVPQASPHVYGSLSAGAAHGIGVEDGAVYTWGDNTYGQLGDDTPIGGKRNYPAQVPGLPDDPQGYHIVQVAAGGAFNLAIDSDGHLWVWGANNVGQAGLNSTDLIVPTPTMIPSLQNITDVAGGLYHAMARDAQGQLYAWGSDDDGELGNGQFTSSIRYPVQVLMPVSVRAGARNAATIAAGDDFSLAIGVDGRIYAWGANFYGQLGRVGPHQAIPGQVINLTNAHSVHAGDEHALATVWAIRRID